MAVNGVFPRLCPLKSAITPLRFPALKSRGRGCRAAQRPLTLARRWGNPFQSTRFESRKFHIGWLVATRFMKSSTWTDSPMQSSRSRPFATLARRLPRQTPPRRYRKGKPEKATKGGAANDVLRSFPLKRSRHENETPPFAQVSAARGRTVRQPSRRHQGKRALQAITIQET